VALVSLRDNLKLSTASGRLMFHVVAAMAEFERELIRVRAGIDNAKAKGIRIGKQRVDADASEVAQLRSEGSFGRKVCRATGLSKGTAQRAFMSVSATPVEVTYSLR
jgi:DNA invertase Pin-like site-specific DNA recombinase